MPGFKPETRFSSQAKEVREDAADTERKFALIDFGDRTFIEKTGGAYKGFVQSHEGRVFEDFCVDRRAHYSEGSKQIIETFVETCGTNELSESEVQTPDQIKAFETMIVELSSSGKELSGPFFIKLHRRNFPSRTTDLARLRLLALAVHQSIVKNWGRYPASELCRQAEVFLEKRGWRKEP
jgi:hypothetical protein